MKITEHSMDSYFQTLSPKRKKDMEGLLGLLKEITPVKPKMWGSIVGYGHVSYQYASGHQGEMPVFSFASRQKAITLYLNCDLSEYDLSHLGQTTQGVGCLYIKSLDAIDLSRLKDLIKTVINDVQSMPHIQSINEPLSN